MKQSAVQGCYKLEIQHTTCRDVVIIDAASDTRKGLIFYAISSVFYALMAVCVKLAGLSGIPTWQIVFCRSVLIMSVSLTRLIRDGDNLLGDRCAFAFYHESHHSSQLDMLTQPNLASASPRGLAVHVLGVTIIS